MTGHARAVGEAPGIQPVLGPELPEQLAERLTVAAPGAAEPGAQRARTRGGRPDARSGGVVLASGFRAIKR